MSSLGPGNYDDIKGSHDLQNGQRLQEDFPGEIKKEFTALLRVSYCWYLNVIDV